MSELAWQRIPLFAGLPPRLLERLAPLAALREVAKDAFLFHEGEPCNGLYVLLDGAVLLSRFGAAEGREVPLHMVLPGQSFAEAALFGGLPFPATARAARPSRIAFLPGPPLLAMIREDPDVALALLASQARWLQRLVGRLAQLGTEDAESRLRGWLRAAGGRTVRIQGTKKALAAQLGMSPETFSRALSALREKGLLEVRGPVIELRGRV